MRLIIDIDEKNVTVMTVSSDTSDQITTGGSSAFGSMPPPGLLSAAAASGAESAGPARAAQTVQQVFVIPVPSTSRLAGAGTIATTAAGPAVKASIPAGSHDRRDSRDKRESSSRIEKTKKTRSRRSR